MIVVSFAVFLDHSIFISAMQTYDIQFIFSTYQEFNFNW